MGGKEGDRGMEVGRMLRVVVGTHRTVGIIGRILGLV